MTKLKNTKKGMAKKALSISLVAAMLATSNVPVWAAEDLFMDNSAAVQEEAAETPAADNDAQDTTVFAPEEETGEGAALLSSTVGAADLNVNVAVDKATVEWGDTATISGSITMKDGGAVAGGWSYRWVDAEDIAQAHADGVSNVANMSLVSTKAMAGKTLTLYVYDDTYDINIGITVAVAKRALAGFTLTSALEYNGFAQSLGDTAVSVVTDSKTETVTAADYAVTSTSATNKDEIITVTLTAAADSAYTGSVSETAEIGARTYAVGDIIASVTEGQAYQYTGGKIEIPSDKVALKESQSADNGADKKLNGGSLASAITKAETTAATVGNQTVDVAIDTAELKNFVADSEPLPTSLTTTEKITIGKRDLTAAGTNITVKDGKIETGTAVSALNGVLTFKAVEDTDTDLTLVKDTDYTITAKTPSGEVATDLNATGTYKVTVTAIASGNCTGSQEFDVKVVGNVITGVEYGNKLTYKPSYTGSAVTPSKTDLGDLTVKGTAGDEALQASEWEITGYTANTDAATYTGAVDSGTIKTQSSVNIKILSGSYTGETFAVPFVIAPLKVAATDVTVPATISYNKNYTKAEEYNVPVTVVAKDKAGKGAKTLTAADYTVAYAYVDGVDKNAEAQNELHDKIQATVTVTNPNYIMGSSDGKKNVVAAEKATEIVAKALTDSMVSVNPSSYTYTGGKITPTYAVVDGVLVLYEGTEYEEVSVTDSVNVGTGTITVKGLDPAYSGTAKGTFTVTAANTSDVKVTIEDKPYTGRQVRPRDFTAALNGNDVSSQFEIVSYGANVEAGKGTVVLKAVEGNKNFTGADITVEFNIIKEQVKADLDVYDAKGIKVTADWKAAIDKNGAVTADGTEQFSFDGNAKTFAKALLSNLKTTTDGKTAATAADFEIKYADNISGRHVTNGFSNIAYVYAVAKDGTGFAGEGQIVTADGTIIKGVVASMPFSIASVEFVDQNVTVKNGVYAGGLPVRPEILVQIGGSTLAEGTDYTVKLTGITTEDNGVDVTNGKIYGVKITGKNGYTGSESILAASWGIDKKDLNDCDVKAVDGVVTVMNGYIPVPATEYSVKENTDKTYTVTANTASKNYTGTKTVTAEGQKPTDKPATPMIQQVKVTGNKATVILSGNCEGATGYDYVISTNGVSSDPNRLVNKNVLMTQTTYNYLQQGMYYAHCHAWKRGADGKKIFSTYSTAYPFVVSAITPDQPGVTSVKVTGSTVKVTYTKSANATGYDIVLGSKVSSVNGEKRPVSYGKLVKKVYKGSTVTATFAKVPKGTYYAGLHAYNRTSENGKKVFSQWSNARKLTVK